MSINRIEDCRTISLRDLKKWQCLKPNYRHTTVIKWSRDGVVNSKIGIMVDTTTDIKYTIDLIAKESNLKKGSTYFLMVCPKTGLLCRKVYLLNGMFLHRTAYATLYDCQAESKKQRSLRTAYARYFACEHAYEEIYSKGFTRMFKGKPTHRYRRLLKKIEA
jgi:hypothetical protein